MVLLAGGHVTSYFVLAVGDLDGQGQFSRGEGGRSWITSSEKKVQESKQIRLAQPKKHENLTLKTNQKQSTTLTNKARTIQWFITAPGGRIQTRLVAT